MLEKLSNLLDVLADGAINFFVFILFVMIGLGIRKGISKLIKYFRRKKNKENEDTENTDNTSNTEDAKLKDLITRYLSLTPDIVVDNVLFLSHGWDSGILNLVQIKSVEDIELIIELYNYTHCKDYGKSPNYSQIERVRKICLDSLNNKTKIVIDRGKVDYKEFHFYIYFTLREFKENLSRFE